MKTNEQWNFSKNLFSFFRQWKCRGELNVVNSTWVNICISSQPKFNVSDSINIEEAYRLRRFCQFRIHCFVVKIILQQGRTSAVCWGFRKSLGRSSSYFNYRASLSNSARPNTLQGRVLTAVTTPRSSLQVSSSCNPITNIFLVLREVWGSHCSNWRLLPSSMWLRVVW